MVRFLDEDVVVFRKDPTIKGSIQRTWDDVDEPAELLHDFYYPKGSSKVKNALLREGKILRPFVIVEIFNSHFGLCLVSDDALLLADRSFAVGDIVKRHDSDVQSGTVISTAMQCTLTSPFCPHEHYRAVSVSNGDQLCDSQKQDPSGLEIAASELKSWVDLREDDFIIYKDWIGRIDDVYESLTILLTNQTIVEITDPDLLHEWFNQESMSGRLAAIGFVPTKSRKSKLETHFVDSYDRWHVGQKVCTTKEILRCGVWKVGRYSPKTPLFGTVLDIRVVEIAVDFMFPNIYKEREYQEAPPSQLPLNNEIRRDIHLYDRNRRPTQENTNQLPDAIHSPDFAAGDFVRLRAPPDAALGVHKHSDVRSAPKFTPEGCPVSQGPGRDVFQIAQTHTTVMVQWQDASISVDAGISFSSYDNTDEHDAWPGEKVSLASQDEDFVNDDGREFTRTKRVGVIQSVDPKERMARLLWYRDPLLECTSWMPSNALTLQYGSLGSVVCDVSLYELSKHSGPPIERGDMVFIVPQVPYVNQTDLKALMKRVGFGHGTEPPNGTSDSSPASIWNELEEHEDGFGGTADLRLVNIGIKRFISAHTQHEGLSPGIDSQSNAMPSSDTAEGFGEVIDLAPDGSLFVRLGASAVCQDVKISPERILVIAGGEVSSDDGTSQDEGDAFDHLDEDCSSANEADVHDENELIKTDVECEGGGPWYGEETAWQTEEDDSFDTFSKEPKVGTDEQSPDPIIMTSDTSTEPATDSEILQSPPIGRGTSDPVGFMVLDSSTPVDHPFTTNNVALDSTQVRRINKEYKILRTSLPEGVFARSWDQRLDLLRILLIGPKGTPYEYSPLMIDMSLGPPFPAEPPEVHFHSWTNRLGRINPNLYEDGHICLSLLGTWQSRRDHEGWSATKSTILQIIVSILGLVLVKEPYYNEAGFDVLVNTPDTAVQSALYNEKVYVLSKAFVQTALKTPPGGLEDVIQHLYISKNGPKLLSKVIDDCQRIQTNSESKAGATDEDQDSQSKGEWQDRRISAGALVLLKRHLEWLVQHAESHGV